MEINNSNGKNYSVILGAIIAASALSALSTTIIWVQQAQAYSLPIISDKTTFLIWHGGGEVRFLPPAQIGDTAILLPLDDRITGGF